MVPACQRAALWLAPSLLHRGHSGGSRHRRCRQTKPNQTKPNLPHWPLPAWPGDGKSLFVATGRARQAPQALACPYQGQQRAGSAMGQATVRSALGQPGRPRAACAGLSQPCGALAADTGTHTAFETKANTSLLAGSAVCSPSCLDHAALLPRCRPPCIPRRDGLPDPPLRRRGLWPRAACWRFGSLAAPAMACVH